MEEIQKEPEKNIRIINRNVVITKNQRGENMKKLAVLLVLASLLILGCAREPIVGGDTDEHGCIGSAGYLWCESKQKCVRAWEEYCAEYKEMFRIRNFDDCVEAGNPTMESYPRQCRAENRTFVEGLEYLDKDDAMAIAEASECSGNLTENIYYNEYTRTWWIDLDIVRQGCSPACVVYEENSTAVINWRCTGLIPNG